VVAFYTLVKRVERIKHNNRGELRLSDCEHELVTGYPGVLSLETG
jgi:hypothetical protein